MSVDSNRRGFLGTAALFASPRSQAGTGVTTGSPVDGAVTSTLAQLGHNCSSTPVSTTPGAAMRQSGSASPGGSI